MLKKIVSCSLAIVLALLGVFSGWGGSSGASAADGINWENTFELQFSKGSAKFNVKTGWVAALKSELGSSAELVFPDEYKASEEYLKKNDDTTFGATTYEEYEEIVRELAKEDPPMSEEEIQEFLEDYKYLFEKQPFELGFQLLTSETESRTENLPNITSVVFGSGIKSIETGSLFRFPNLEKVTFNADQLKLQESFAFLKDFSNENNLETYASKIKEIHFDGATIESVEANAFSHINLDGLKIYVKSAAVKETLQKAVPALTDDKFSDTTANLPEPEIQVTCPDIHKGEVFDPKVEIIKGDQTQDDVIIDKSLYLDEKCETKAGYYYYSLGITEGKYYLKVTLKPTENYKGLEKVIPIEMLSNENVNKTALDAAIAEADKFYADNQYNQVNYKKEDWDKVFGTRGALAKAKEISADQEGSFPQNQIDEATTNLTNALNALNKSVADNTEAWNKLQDVIKKAKDIIANDKDKYTEDSWTAADLQSRIDDAEKLKKDDAAATVKEIERLTYLIESAIGRLKEPDKKPTVEPGEPFAFIPKKGSQVKVLSMTAPEKLAGAKKVRVTFQCAEDVSFNQHSSIDITANVGGVETYEQIKGAVDDWTTGKVHTVEFELTEAIKAGDSIELIMATFSWDDAKDYVYGITAIEFVDADNNSLGAYIDADVYKENLASAIKEAEAINTATYTAESVEKLKKALEAAKALAENATAAEMKKAIDDINDAIKGLTKRDDEEEAREKLTAKVKEAEAIDTSLYTPESVEKLKKALEAAKALKEDASEEEVNKALAAIEEAIKGLVKKDGSGGTNQQPPTTNPTAKVIGVAQGKTFTAGNFTYKVSAAATITGTVKKAGKVTVVGLSKAGKKKSSINVKNTVSASGASYQVTGIGSKAFRKAAKLKKATLGSNIKAIPASAFDSCKKLTAVKATGVTKIGKNAFKGCKAFNKLTLGKKKLSSVSKGAFKGCKKTIKVAGGSKKVKKGNVKKLKKSGYKKFK